MNTYTRQNPFLAKIKERKALTSSTSKKITFHLVLDLQAKEFPYKVGDSIGIFSQNPEKEVHHILTSLNLSPLISIVTKKHETLTFKDFLLKKANLKRLSKKFWKILLEKLTNNTQKEELASYLFNDDKKVFQTWSDAWALWDCLAYFSSMQWEAQEIVDLLAPLLPRLYSIASSPLSYSDQIHLCIAHVQYSQNNVIRTGVCSDYLWNCPLHSTIPIYIQPSKDFHLPKDHTKDIIMIGPGTGIAPFIAFMQERKHQQATGSHWLFFGDWHRDQQFYYSETLLAFEREGFLKLSLAFSRDQKEKIYVQDRMLDQGNELLTWLERGAYMYICGSIAMGKDVEKALLKLLLKQPSYSKEDEAKAYLKSLRQEGRLVKDVY